MASINIDVLYECFDTISDDSIDDSQKIKAFEIIMKGTKAGSKEKRLASQFIGRFFKKFKNEQEESFDCILNLCDDVDVDIRKQAVHDLQQICKHETAFMPRVADVLGQMLTTDDSSEAHIINLGLFGLLTMDPKNTLTGIFNQMLSDNSESPRDNIIKFLAENLKRLPSETLTPELEELILEQTNKVLQDVSEDEFIQLISVLSSLKCMSSLTGRQKLVTMITDQVIQAVPVFNPQDMSCVAQVRESGKQALRFLSKNVTAGPFLNYALSKVIPKIELMDNAMDQRDILRIIAELTMHPGETLTTFSIDECSVLLLPLYTSLINFLPNVPKDLTEAFVKLADIDGVQSDCQDINIFVLECLFYSLLSLINFCPNFLTFGDQKEIEKTEGTIRLQTLRQKAQYLARVIQSYRLNLITSLEKKFKDDDQSKDKLTNQAKNALLNTETLIRALFRNRVSPETTAGIILSWKEPATITPLPLPGGLKQETMASKRPASGIGEASRETKQVYRAPTGQWSGGFNFGRGRGGFNKNRGGRFKRGRF